MRHGAISLLLACVLALACVFTSHAAMMPDFLSDAPDETAREADRFIDASSYSQALYLWKSPEDVNAWIGARFTYDMDRAKRLALGRGSESQASVILTPEQLFAAPKGICVDLARFGVETVRQTAPELSPRYVRIEFEPATIGGATLRFHWLAVFTREGSRYFFADSKRPGYLAGPYASLDAFIKEYALYRQRPVIAFQELDTFQRRARPAAIHMRSSGPSPAGR